MFLGVCILALFTATITYGYKLDSPHSEYHGNWYTLSGVFKKLYAERHYFFNNELLLPYLLAVWLTFVKDYHSATMVIVVVLFFKFFGKLRDNVLWSIPSLAIIVFLNYGPANLIIGLELLAMVLTVVAIRFFRENIGAVDDKRVLHVFLLNFLSFLILFFLLTNWSLFSSVDGGGFWNTKTRTFVLVYYSIKFGTLLAAVLKIFFYESMPLQVLAFVTILQTVFIPLLTFPNLNGFFNVGSIVAAIIFLVANAPMVSNIIETKNLTLLLAYTTALTNGWAILLFVL